MQLAKNAGWRGETVETEKEKAFLQPDLNK